MFVFRHAGPRIKYGAGVIRHPGVLVFALNWIPAFAGMTSEEAKYSYKLCAQNGPEAQQESS
jgi:hypothetical protein